MYVHMVNILRVGFLYSKQMITNLFYLHWMGPCQLWQLEWIINYAGFFFKANTSRRRSHLCEHWHHCGLRLGGTAAVAVGLLGLLRVSGNRNSALEVAAWNAHLAGPSRQAGRRQRGWVGALFPRCFKLGFGTFASCSSRPIRQYPHTFFQYH